MIGESRLFSNIAWLLIATLCFQSAVFADDKKDPATRINPNVYLALINGAAAALSSGSVTYQTSGDWGPTLAVASLSGAINGAWQLTLDPVMRWMNRPYFWDRHGFPSRNIKLGLTTIACTAAMGCVMHLNGLTDGNVFHEAAGVLSTTAKYMVAAVPIYETVHLYEVPNPSRTRRFLMNLIPFTMEVTLTAAMAAALIGLDRASDAAFAGLVVVGGTTWLAKGFSGFKAMVRTGINGAAGFCRLSYGKLRRAAPPKKKPR